MPGQPGNETRNRQDHLFRSSSMSPRHRARDGGGGGGATYGCGPEALPSPAAWAEGRVMPTEDGGGASQSSGAQAAAGGARRGYAGRSYKP